MFFPYEIFGNNCLFSVNEGSLCTFYFQERKKERDKKKKNNKKKKEKKKQQKWEKTS